MWKNNFCQKSSWGFGTLILAISLLTSCAVMKRYHLKEYYPSGELKKEEISTPYEYESREYYENGVKRREILSNRRETVLKEYFEDGKLKSEKKNTPSPEEYRKKLQE